MERSGPGCKLRWCEPVQARMWPLVVVVDPPRIDDPSGVGVVGEQMLVQAFIPRPAFHALRTFAALLAGHAGGSAHGPNLLILSA